MITIDFTRFPVGPGNRLLDVGCGNGRHAFEAYRRGADVVALDTNEDDLVAVKDMFAAMELAGEAGQTHDGHASAATTVHGDARTLPFPDGTFDRVVAAEVLEHIPDDAAAIAEVARVLAPGGLAAVTVPRWWPERVCWALSTPYHEVEGGHVRIYKASELVAKLRAAGLEPVGSHHAHALHAPYWWLKCAVGVDRETALTRAYHRLLVWDLMKAPRLTRTAERLLNPVLGKSVVVYLRKPER